MKLNVVYKKLREITPYDKNAKKHDKTQIANVAESIKQYGFVQPIVIDRDGVIVRPLSCSGGKETWHERSAVCLCG